MIESLRVAQVLGGVSTLGMDVTTLHKLAESVSSGLPKQALRRVAQRVFDSPKDVNQLIYSLVPEATYKRRTRLTPAESERTERLARVIANAEYVWDGQPQAREWLTRTHPELGNHTPLERAMSELGAREVEELLDRLLYGIPA